MSVKKNIALLGSLTSMCVFADTPIKEEKTISSYHAFVATGYAWSMEAGIHNPQGSFWDASDEGYNSTLGNASFFTLGFGHRFWKMLDVDLNYNFYDTFHYQKRQTSSTGQSGDVRVRYFDLDNQSAMVNLSLYPYTVSLGHWMEWMPFFGAGIGVGINQVTNFQTVGNNTPGVGSVTSTGQPRTTVAFAWQAIGGMRFQPKNSILSVDIAYRYYNGGRFNCPSTITSFVSSGEEFTGKPWKGTLQTNQLYLSANVAF